MSRRYGKAVPSLASGPYHECVVSGFSEALLNIFKVPLIAPVVLYSSYSITTFPRNGLPLLSFPSSESLHVCMLPLFPMDRC